ncbi:MAG: hypothetical protein DMF78_08355 [Acidobacteria bacterium]|nr:MAG: hypothetical protein DMF78_08355 [Acidobacteriota bacterium]
MPRKMRTHAKPEADLPEDLSPEEKQEVAITPSATAVAAEAQLTGVVPLESQHRHADESEIPGEDDVLRVGDPDDRPTDNAFVGDDTPGGDSPTPDQNQVDDIGRAYGVQEEDSGALRTSSEILDRRDQRRGFLDVPEPTPGTVRRR